MWRLALTRNPAISRFVCAARSATITACPYGHATPTATAQEMNLVEGDHCPVIGTAPAMSCPIEHPSTLRAPTTYEMLSTMGKTQLSAYVAATALAGYVIGYGGSPLIAAALTAGTMLQSCSANTANQVIEMNYDKLMKRTCRRPLPMGHITRQNACFVSAAELALGTGLLATFSPAAAALGVLNWFLYVGMYTPLKRVSPTNTWFGSIVGGIPPLMGGVAVSGTISAPVWMLATFLFVWQIPHFHGLAFHCRRDYEAAGYKMLAFSNPWRSSFYAVLLSVVMAFLTMAVPALIDMPVEGVWYYPVAAVANAGMIYKSVLFHQAPVRHCRGCFVFSYVYLMIMLGAIMLNHYQPMHTVNGLIASYTTEQPILMEETLLVEEA